MLKTEHVDDKLSSKRPLISKQSSMADLNRPSKSSYTYYGGVSAGVPFLWESKPGTPKHSSSNSTHNNTTSSSFFPPLNPPPCYNSRNPPPQSPTRRRSKSFAWSKFCILVGRNKSRRSDGALVPESLSPSSSSSASSAPSSPAIRPLASFRRSQSTSTRHTKSEFDYEFYDDDRSASTPVSRGSTARCFWR